ncbi:hypothetical protein PFRA20S_01185 [Pseudomonas fragi]|nr:hypothetical protein SAMN05216594_2859 [Pseudomonas fragi]
MLLSTRSSCRRLRSAAKPSQARSLRCVRLTVNTDSTTASPPNAAFGSCYKIKGISQGLASGGRSPLKPSA